MKKFAVALLVFVSLCVPCLAAESLTGFKKIEIDSFIVGCQADVEKSGKTITMMRPISFVGKMKRLPEEKNMNYVYVAMEMSGIDPMPTVKDRMFVETKEGRIFPVYVEESAKTKIVKGLGVDVETRFLGYHAYSYTKGPAIVVVDFESI